MRFNRISKSFLATFKVCAFKADAHHNQGIDSIANIWAERGKTVHKLKEQIDSGLVSFEDARKLTNDPDVWNLVDLAVKNDPFHGYPDQICEAHVQVNESGDWVDDEESAVAHGYLDRTVFLPEELVVEDLKTGSSESDDETERHMYAGLLAKAAQPDFNRIRFVRYFVKSGHRPSWLYEWEKGKDGQFDLYITGPKGDRVKFRGRHESNPMVLWLQRHVARVRKAEPKPRPGSHCRNWYGSPCQFLGNICPLSDRMPDLIPAPVPLGTLQKDSFLRFFRDDNYLSLDAATASQALDAVFQLEAGTREVEKRIKQWANANGNLRLHNEEYGWSEKPEPVIDKVEAVKYLFEANVSWEELAKAINISKSSIEKLPKTCQSIREELLSMFNTINKRKFGLIRQLTTESGGE